VPHSVGTRQRFFFFAECRIGEASGKDFSFFTYNLFAGCYTVVAPGKEIFFYFFRIFFAE
jgi:hypothetical protein